VGGLSQVIVGVSGTPGSLPALRYAARIARLYDATLVPVHAWVPPGGDLADRRCPSTYLRRIWADEARERLKDALNIAWGGEMTEVEVRPVVTRGQPGPALVDMADADDMLVIGGGRQGWLSRIWHGQVSRYCLAHAPCPVLAVPPPALDRTSVRSVLRAASSNSAG
jgi:nucleotide-binding universal stress UspA family protein